MNFARTGVAILILALPPVVLAKDPAPTFAAFNVSSGDLDLDTASGPESVEIRRLGFEYWEQVVGDFQMGIDIGLSESERPAAMLGVAGGHYGGIGLKYDAAITESIGIGATAMWRVQDEDSLIVGVTRDVRMYESRFTLAPSFTLGVVTLEAGASWRRIDYREVPDDGSAAIRAVEDPKVVSFAALGLRTDRDGVIRFEATSGEQSGWRVQFARKFR